jgi:hypothetical protein
MEGMMNGDPKNPDPRGPTPEADVVHEFKVMTEEGRFEVGVIRINHERTPVAYAQLGETTVSIGRGTDGRLRVQIQDEAEESVYISVNAMPLVKDPAETNGWELPWNMDRCLSCGEPVFQGQKCESCGCVDGVPQEEAP